MEQLKLFEVEKSIEYEVFWYWVNERIKGESYFFNAITFTFKEATQEEKNKFRQNMITFIQALNIDYSKSSPNYQQAIRSVIRFYIR
jgi:hypothetical protein